MTDLNTKKNTSKPTNSTPRVNKETPNKEAQKPKAIFPVKKNN
jgi:hypothetical protein